MSRTKGRRLILGLLAPALAGCAAFVPLREPPRLALEDPPGDARTRDEVVALFGPPEEVRASDVGRVLVYRRLVTLDESPARYYGRDRRDRFAQYRRILIYLDPEGRVVRATSELE
jgi:hypothetical protein